MISHYEEGTFTVNLRNRWWKFWMPNNHTYGRYCRIGSQVTIYILGFPYSGITLSLPYEKEHNMSSGNLLPISLTEGEERISLRTRESLYAEIEDLKFDKLRLNNRCEDLERQLDMALR